MTKYERIREIRNSCDNSRMRDIAIDEIAIDDIDADVLQFCGGTTIRREKKVGADGSVIFEISADGLSQRVSYTKLPERV